MSPTVKVVLISIAFLIFWILIIFPAVPLPPIGRTVGSLLGAMLIVAFRVTTPDEAYTAIDLSFLGLLFVTMVVSIYLERADMFKYLGKLLSWKSMGGNGLLYRACVASTISNALFINEYLLRHIYRVHPQDRLPEQPAPTAVSAFSHFKCKCWVVRHSDRESAEHCYYCADLEILERGFTGNGGGVMVNIVILLCYFWKVLTVEKDEESAVASTGDIFVEEDVTSSHRFLPTTMSHNVSFGSVDGDASAQGSPLDSRVLSESEINSTTEVVRVVSLSMHGRFGNQRNCFVVRGSLLAMDEKVVPIEK